MSLDAYLWKHVLSRLVFCSLLQNCLLALDLFPRLMLLLCLTANMSLPDDLNYRFFEQECSWTY